MSKLLNVSISKRLGFGFSLVLVLLVAQSIAVLWQMRGLAANTEYFANNLVPSYEAEHKAYVALGESRRAEFRQVLAKTAAELDAQEVRRARARDSVLAELDRYGKSLVSDEVDAKLLAEARSAIGSYFEAGQRLTALARTALVQSSGSDEAVMFLVGPSSTAFKASEQAIQKWWDYNVKLAAEKTASSNQTYSMAQVTVSTLAICSVLLGALAAVYIARSVTRPIAEAAAVAKSVAAGDLSLRVVSNGTDETGQLLRALGEMTDTLRRVVGAVREGSESVATASVQIALGNSDLSQRTEEQASALQQTAATMEQLGSTVRSNAESARQADQLAQAAAGVAEQGGQVVSQVVGTMHAISDSGRTISEIISVIDGIAFQTNILALNAAVEAARAGEQGRGFAVVAGEVRNLAKRSADAAKEIKALITRNVEQVEQGAALVDHAGSTMNEIVASVRRVSDIVSEINAATMEQSRGIAQVGDAVGQMDQVTQQNAALVEESAAAAESLKVQAAHLVQSVAFFKVQDSRPGLPEAGRSAAPVARAPGAYSKSGPDVVKIQALATVVREQPTQAALASRANTATPLTPKEEWASF